MIETQEIEERGFFWWAEETIPAGHFAPRGAVSGSFKIRPDGQTTLKLDGTLPRTERALADFSDERPSSRAIVGILASSDRYVRLERLYPDGGKFSSRGPSFEGFAALTCVVSKAPLTGSVSGSCCTSVELSLEGFEAWLRLRAIRTRQTETGLIAEYHPPSDHSYDLNIGAQLAVRFEATASPSTYDVSLTISQRGLLAYIPASAITLGEVQEITSRFEDLMILLSDTERDLGWPQVRLVGQAGWSTLYYARIKRPGATSSPLECWTDFPNLADCFGEVAAAWIVKHKEFGPGFHLYLGNRGGLKLYVEHRFVNLVWGLESLHRRIEKPGARPKLAAKIARILNSVEEKDRKWLERQLRHAGEPSLSNRLAEMLQALPFDFGAKALEEFASLCAARRNDISHFGGQRASGAYKELLHDLERLTDALDLLYHARILQEIGIPDDHLRWWFVEGFTSHRIRRALEAVGLQLPPSKQKFSSS